MINNAPMWLNEFLVDSLRIIIGLSIIINIIFIIIFISYIGKGLYCKYKLKEKYKGYFTRNKLALYSVIVILTFTAIGIFYLPKQVIAQDYSIQGIHFIRGNYSTPIDVSISISEKSLIKELQDILDEYKCKRILFDTTIISKKPISTIVIYYDKNINETLSLELIIDEDSQKVYMSYNTGFLYTICNHDGMLYDKLYNYYAELLSKDTSGVGDDLSNIL